MNSNERPDPDSILRAINEKSEQAKSGQLRVFLGMSAGVGKTYAMLKAAHQKKIEGSDIVIGVVETHGRSDTANLLTGHEIIERKKINYRGTQIEEMDLDAILRRRPKIVLVDELAHSNGPGSRHEKRYQDVLEIMATGIDVYTTLNVQHLESRKDSVELITGITIRETVPDSILEKATLVELVDIAPSELLKRLKEGKVYLGAKANTAAENFFKEDKLTALREIALRMTAEKVDQDLRKFSIIRDETPWQTNERILVAVSHSPFSEKLIRATRRLAYNLEAPWIAVHVDTGVILNDADQAQLFKNLNLARELNAEVISTTDIDVASALKRLCRQKNANQVVVGRPGRRWFRDFLEGGSLLDRLVKDMTEVDVHVIRQDKAESFRTTSNQDYSNYQTGNGWVKYYYSFWFLVVVTIIGLALEPFIGYRAVGFIFLLAVTISSVFGSVGAVLLTATLSAVTWNFFFIPPKYTFIISQPDDLILCISYFVVAVITGFLTNRLRVNQVLIRDREEKTNILYQILQDISNSQNKSEFIQKTTERISLLLDAQTFVILKSKEGSLDFSKLEKNTFSFFDEKEQAVALWSFDNKKSAGWSTETLGQANSLYIPLRGINETVGIFLFHPKHKTRKLSLDQEVLLYSITNQLSISIERHFLSRRLNETQRLKDSEALHQTLLNSISHEMRTPLTAILSSAAALEKRPEKDAELISISAGLSDAGDRLNRVIENLLDMSRLNSGVLGLKIEWHDLSDLFGVALGKLTKNLSQHKVEVSVSQKIELIQMDFRLFEHALSNLLINSSQYGGPNLNIKINADLKDGKISLSISDDGVGIPEDSVSQIFNKFYRVPGTPAGGTGLGLSIVKEIVELHKGKIQYETNAPHGAKFIIELPFVKAPIGPSEGKT